MHVSVTVYEGNVRALDDQLKKAVISGILISFVTAAICIIWISVNVLGSIRRLKGQLRGMIQSGNYEEIQLEATLEMNELGHIFDELLSSLGDQLWVKKGNQQLYSLLNKNQNSSRIMDTYLSEMLAYGGFLSAAYYHMKEDRLELNGVVGRMAFMKDTYTYDDKAVGKCAKTNRVQVIPLDAVGLK